VAERRLARFRGDRRARVRRLALGLALALTAAPTTRAEPTEAERACAEWADGLFRTDTDRKRQAIARCIAERDPGSPQAAARREAARRDEAERQERAARSDLERAERAQQEEAAVRNRCGDELVVAFGPLHFCDSEAAVMRKAQASDDIECEARGECDRLRVRSGPLQLTAYPKYSERGLTRLVFYADERDTSEYETGVRGDWEGLVALVEAEHGSADAGTQRFPGFFSVVGVHVVRTQQWELGGRRILVGIFEGGETYAATMTIEEAREPASAGPAQPTAAGDD
jgi:hypothetical protein